MNRISLLFSVLMLLVYTTSAQDRLSVKGKIIDSVDQSELPGATILLIYKKDTIQKTGTTSNAQGDFAIDVKPGNYNLHISYIGYNKENKSISLTKKPLDLGTLKLTENSELIEEVQVTEALPAAIQKGDTTIYNPDAVKVNPDATVGELIAKMPGFYEIDGKLIVNGQEVAEVLIDGKKYFGNNIYEALALLPTDVVKKIVLFKHKSDESEFSGFEDKEEKKTINIVTKRNEKNLLFGDVASAIGKSNKYGIDGNVNSFSENKCYSFSGSTKNVNAPLKLRGRALGGGSVSGDEMQLNSFRININTGKKKNQLSVGYGLNDRQSSSENRNIRAYNTEALEGQIQETNSISDSKSLGHSMNIHWKLNNNQKHSVMLSSRVNTSKSESLSRTSSETLKTGKLFNSNTNNNSSNNKSLSLGQQFNYAYRFEKKGRSLSFQSSFNYSKAENDGRQLSEVRNERDSTNSTINRISENKSKNNGVRAGVSYNDVIGENSRITFGYSLSLNPQKSDKTSYNFDVDQQAYTILDTLTTNRFDNSGSNQNLRFTYNYLKDKHNLSLSGNLQHIYLRNEEHFPKDNILEKGFLSFLPSILYRYKIKDHSNLNLSYSRNTQNPSLRDLQEVVDLSNPMYISIGNPELDRSQSHNTSVSVMSINSEKGRFFSANIRASFGGSTVGRRTIIAANDTLINNKYNLPAGGQFSQAINLDGQYNFSSGISYSLPIKKLKAKLNSNTSTNLSHRPTFVNNQKAFTNSWSVHQGFTWSSNISEKIDYTVSTATNYSTSQNGTSLRNKYFSQTIALNLYWNFYKNFIFRTNANNSYQNNFATNNEEMYWRMNLGLSTKLFKNKRAELSLSAYDILNNKDERRHAVTELYTEDSYNNKLSQFYMVSFSYKLRNNKG